MPQRAHYTGNMQWTYHIDHTPHFGRGGLLLKRSCTFKGKFAWFLAGIWIFPSAREIERLGSKRNRAPRVRCPIFLRPPFSSVGRAILWRLRSGEGKGEKTSWERESWHQREGTRKLGYATGIRKGMTKSSKMPPKMKFPIKKQQYPGPFAARLLETIRCDSTMNLN